MTGSELKVRFRPIADLPPSRHKPPHVKRINAWTKNLKREVVAPWNAARSRRTPVAAKIVAGAVAAYALSPIDVIPGFIPILGYLDDVVLVPLGVALAVRLIPPALMAEFRAEAVSTARPVNKLMAKLIVIVWLTAFVTAAAWLWHNAR